MDRKQIRKACRRYAWPIGMVAIIPGFILFAALTLMVHWIPALAVSLVAFVWMGLYFVRYQADELEALFPPSHQAGPATRSAPAVLYLFDEEAGVAEPGIAAWLSIDGSTFSIATKKRTYRFELNGDLHLTKERRGLRRFWSLIGSQYEAVGFYCAEREFIADLQWSMSDECNVRKETRPDRLR